VGFENHHPYKPAVCVAAKLKSCMESQWKRHFRQSDIKNCKLVVSVKCVVRALLAATRFRGKRPKGWADRMQTATIAVERRWASNLRSRDYLQQSLHKIQHSFVFKRFTCVALKNASSLYGFFLNFFLRSSNEYSLLLWPSVRFQHLTVLSGG